jgi:hypothetical protein
MEYHANKKKEEEESNKITGREILTIKKINF